MIKNIFLFILMTVQMDFIEAQSKLIYVGDPMCSWCYGIAPELDDLIESLDDDIKLEVVMGGLRPYNTESMTDLKDFLTHHWRDVHSASGQKFNYQVLERSDWKYDTEPPCRAVTVIKQMMPRKELEFFKEVQFAFYWENKNLSMVSSYYPILDKLEIDKKKFETLFLSEEFKNRVTLEFQRARSLGVNSFPTILLEHNGKVYTVANGYAKAERMESIVNTILK